MKMNATKFLVAALGLTAFFTTPSSAAESETTVLAAGCFWCLEAVFEAQPGVTNVVSGYAGGHSENPTYEESNTGKTGHAEAVQITFDPAKTSYEKLLDIYWKSFDPTNGRGVAPDFGSQYRPIILYESDAQRATAEASKAALQKSLGKTVAVEVAPLKKFWPAEDYHQNYVKNHPESPYVRKVSYERMDRVGVAHP